MDPRNVPLRHGDARWLFQALHSSEDLAAVNQILEAADELVYKAGTIRGDAPDATFPGGIPHNRLYYQRLGPGPDTAVLMAESSGPIEIELICTPRDPHQPEQAGPVHHPGPPWKVLAWISLECDSEPRTTCPGHLVLAWSANAASTPPEAAEQLHAAASWLLEHASDSISDLRRLDQRDGHRSGQPQRD